MEEVRIIDLFWNRQEEAITQVASTFGAYCHHIAYRILLNHEDTEECLNDTWLRAWNAIPPTRPGSLKAFLGKITRNLAINSYKARQTIKRGGEIQVQPIEELYECASFSNDNVTAYFEEEFLKETLNDFLEKQKEKERRIFVRRYFYMDDIKEIADRFDVKESYVKVVLFRLREKLRERLKMEGQL